MASPYFSNLDQYTQWPRPSFLEPFSTRSEPFTEWQKQPYSFFTDDFSHDKTFVTKFNASTSRSSLKIKETVSAKKGGFELTDQVKLWFDLPSHGTLYAKVKSSDYIKVHYDHGLRKWNDKSFYVFGGFNATKVLKNVNFRLGFGHVAQNLQNQTRLKVALDGENNNYLWYNKFFVNKDKFRFGLMTVVNLHQFVFQKNNLLFGWNYKDNNWAYLRAEVNGFRHEKPVLTRIDTLFDNVIADVVQKINDKSTVGLQANFNIRQRALDEVKGVVQYKYAEKKTLKASINDKFNLAFSGKIPLYGLEDSATLTAGIGISGLAEKQFTYKTGFELNLNI